MLAKAIVAMLRHPSLSAVSDAIYPRTIPSNTPLPALAYQELPSRPNLALDRSGYRSGRVQITLAASGEEEAAALAKTLRTALCDSAGPFGGCDILRVSEEQELPNLASDKFYRIIDFSIHYEE